MELWLRFPQAESLLYDKKIHVQTQTEWEELIKFYKPISSILWPFDPMFSLVPEPESPVFRRRHPHEKYYQNDSGRNLSYQKAAAKAALKLNLILKGEKVLVYAPLRGALPIWLAICKHLKGFDWEVYYPVTSSFVFYPQDFRIKNKKGRPASGRTTHILELKRLKPFLNNFSIFLYIDEIVSGGMMAGYLKEMILMELTQKIPVVAAGLADDFGARSVQKRTRIDNLVHQGVLKAFIWEGCQSLITEDQKFLLGIHYIDYNKGLNIIPMLDVNNEEYPEKKQFDQDVFGGPVDPRDLLKRR
jgi:hypothetical protein